MVAKKKQQPLVLFDVDGVIVDSFECLYVTISGYLKEKKNEELTREAFRDLFAGNALAALMERLGHNVYDAVRSFVHMSKMLFHGYQNAPLFPGIEAALEAIAKKATLVVITSSPAEIVQLRFSHAGIDRFFAAYLGPESGVKKDEKINKAIAEFSTPGAPVYFVTDTSGDIAEAKKTRVKIVGVTWGYHNEATIQAAKPDAIARRPQELLTLLLS